MQIRRVTTLTVLLAAEAGTAIILLHLPGDPPSGPTSFLHGPPENVVVVAARLLAVGLAFWLLATTGLYTLARASRVPALLRAVQWATLPPLRGLIDGLLVTTVVAGAALANPGVAAAAPGDGPLVVPIGQDSAATRTSAAAVYRPRPAGDAEPGAPAYQPRAAGDPAPGGETGAIAPQQVRSADSGTPATITPPVNSTPAPAAPSYTVRPGDNLWRISMHHVAAETGRPAHNLGRDEVRAYWIRLASSNREQLRSRNPSLIRPGEVIALPPLFEPA